MENKEDELTDMFQETILKKTKENMKTKNEICEDCGAKIDINWKKDGTEVKTFIHNIDCKKFKPAQDIKEKLLKKISQVGLKGR